MEPAALLPEMTEGEQVVEDYVSMRLTLRSHPVALIRHLLSPGLTAPPVATSSGPAIPAPRRDSLS